jgi:hypothetical protein
LKWNILDLFQTIEENRKRGRGSIGEREREREG